MSLEEDDYDVTKIADDIKEQIEAKLVSLGSRIASPVKKSGQSIRLSNLSQDITNRLTEQITNYVLDNGQAIQDASTRFKTNLDLGYVKKWPKKRSFVVEMVAASKSQDPAVLSALYDAVDMIKEVALEQSKEPKPTSGTRRKN